eukprot:6201117-Pleurochrysis_carterae.AAC.1
MRGLVSDGSGAPLCGLAERRSWLHCADDRVEGGDARGAAREAARQELTSIQPWVRQAASQGEGAGGPCGAAPTMLPPFTAWLNKTKLGRLTLVLEFKVVILHETGQISWPPNCVYPEAAARRTQAVALKSLAEMVERKCPLSKGLWVLLGRDASSLPVPKTRPLSSTPRRQTPSPSTSLGNRKKTEEGSGWESEGGEIAESE